MLGGNVLTMEAISAVTLPDKGREFSRSELTWVRDGDAWRIAEAEDRFMVDPDLGQQALAQLAWMEGIWKDDVAGATVETRVTWTPGRRFLTRSFTVTEEGGGPVESTEIIGFDPVLGVIHSWSFDNAGGFGEGLCMAKIPSEPLSVPSPPITPMFGSTGRPPGAGSFWLMKTSAAAPPNPTAGSVIGTTIGMKPSGSLRNPLMSSQPSSPMTKRSQPRSGAGSGGGSSPARSHGVEAPASKITSSWHRPPSFVD